MKKILMTAAAAFLTACSGHAESDHTANQAHQSAEGIVISSARVLPPFPGRDTSAGYFEIVNHGSQADKLIAASSPVSEVIEIHNHIEEDGVMKMRRVDGIDLPPGEKVIFKPGSYHLMMFKTNLPEGETSIPLTLNYQNADPVTLIFDIEGHDEEEPGSGYGSSHSGN